MKKVASSLFVIMLLLILPRTINAMEMVKEERNTDLKVMTYNLKGQVEE